MRMRKKKHLDARLAACRNYLVPEGAAPRGQWPARSGGRPLALEIGCGKGGFITQLAQSRPDLFFVAVERVPSVLLLALERARALGLQNLLFLPADAELLGQAFAEGEVDQIYLNFSDPWRPKRHWKRRLTHPRLLAVYDGFLRPGGRLLLKTDNDALFEFSLCQLSQFGYRLEEVTLDLHRSGLPNILTEYEAQFAAQGLPIRRLTAQKPNR